MKRILIIPSILIATIFLASPLFAEDAKQDKAIDVQVTNSTAAAPQTTADTGFPEEPTPIPAPFLDAVRQMQRLSQTVTEFDDDFRRGFNEGWGGRYSGGPNFRPAIDVMETPSEMIITCDMPGVEKNDIKIEINGTVLTIRGKRDLSKEEITSDKTYRFHRHERSYGAFTRTVRVPDTVDPSKVNADFKDGILTVRLPKLKKDQPIQVKVN
jgi:HSP20 family protein